VRFKEGTQDLPLHSFPQSDRMFVVDDKLILGISGHTSGIPVPSYG
jgi:hypothetical protein